MGVDGVDGAVLLTLGLAWLAFWALRVPTAATAHFVGIGDYALGIEMHADVLKTTWREFREVRTTLLLRLLDIVEAGGARLAKPAQINCFARGRVAAPADVGNTARPDARVE